MRPCPSLKLPANFLGLSFWRAGAYDNGMRNVVLGAGGQLGQALCQALAGDVVGLTRREADLTRVGALRETLAALKPAVVINAAGFTHVDRAEAEPERAFAVNGLALRDLAFVCRDLGAVLVHISTNYVFGLDGRRDTPYAENDPTGPVNVYGVSKLAGEAFVRCWCPRHFIVRTCGLYGTSSAGVGRGNFVTTMLRLARTGEPIRVVNDQICTPTSAADLASAVRELLGSDVYGIYHITNGGACTWYEFARAIFESAGVAAPLEPIPSWEFASPARRPRFSVLSNHRWVNSGHTPLRPWREALDAFVRTVK